MRAKHTPGPWVLEILQGYDSFDCPVDSDVEITAADGKHIHSHDLGYRDDTDEEIKANARLIAAAPDLLDALKALTDRMSLYAGHHDDELTKIGRAAIAKATGEAQ